MKSQEYILLIEARDRNREAINELRDQPEAAGEYQVKALLAKEKELTRLIEEEIAKSKK